jgi:pseudomonalisin
VFSSSKRTESDAAIRPIAFPTAKMRETPQQCGEALRQQAASEGITWIASSGDSGAAACEIDSGMEASATTELSVNVPASVPEVTGVGGTEFVEGGANYFSNSPGPNGGTPTSYIPEIAWNHPTATGFAASGGGSSVFYSKPYWQTGPGVPNDGQRDVPDVALTASWFHDPYFAVSGGQLFGAGGTPAAAPVFAGIVVLLNQYWGTAGLGNINPTSTPLAKAFRSFS